MIVSKKVLILMNLRNHHIISSQKGSSIIKQMSYSKTRDTRVLVEKAHPLHYPRFKKEKHYLAKAVNMTRTNLSKISLTEIRVS